MSCAGPPPSADVGYSGQSAGERVGAGRARSFSWGAGAPLPDDAQHVEALEKGVEIADVVESAGVSEEYVDDWSSDDTDCESER